MRFLKGRHHFLMQGSIYFLFLKIQMSAIQILSTSDDNSNPALDHPVFNEW